MYNNNRILKKGKSELVYNIKYYIGKVCSGQRGTAFELATTIVQLLIRGVSFAKRIS